MDYMLQKNKLVLQENLDLQNIKNDIKKIYFFIHKIVSNNENKNEIPENILENFQKSIDEISQKTLIINDINDIFVNVLDSLQEFPKLINNEFNELKSIFKNQNNTDYPIKDIPADVRNEIDNLKRLIDSSIQKINSDVSSIKTDITSLKDKDSNFINKINKISADLELLRSGLNKNIQDIQNKLNLTIVNVNTATTNIKILSDNVNKTRSDISTVQNSITSINARIDTLINNVSNVLNNFADLRRYQTDLTRQIDNLSKKLQLTQDDLSNTKNNINININSLKKDLDKAKSDLNNNINDNTNNLQNDLINTKNEISNTFTTNITTLKNNIDNNVNTITNDIINLRDNLANTNDNISIIYTQDNKNNIRTIYFKNAEIDNIVSKDFTLLSDKRLKKDIANIEYPKKLFKLKTKKYKWKNDNTNDTGFIAQEVKELFPEMVNEDKNGILSVNYIKFVPLIVEIVKKQNNEILFLKIGFILLFIFIISIIIYIKSKNI